MNKISIIIPVYNVKEYLNICIDSILKQSFNDYEIILVNDGSTDSSGEICDMYSEKYTHIKVFHKENGGLSDARNAGIREAKGEYILFIDSDDYITENSLSKINDVIREDTDVQVIFLEADKVFPDNTKKNLGDGYQKNEIFKQTHEHVLNHLITLPKFPGSACTKLVNRSLIIDNKLFFEKGQLSEDIDWTMRLLLTATKYNYCESEYYCYRQNRTGSITDTANFKNLYSLLEIIKKWSVDLREVESPNKFQTYINSFMAYEYLIILLLNGKISSADKAIVSSDILAYSWLLSHSKNNKVRLVKNLNKVLGINTISNILFFYYKVR
jgi:glycosyltransferase involved in cell wall biosynthesis